MESFLKILDMQRVHFFSAEVRPPSCHVLVMTIFILMILMELSRPFCQKRSVCQAFLVLLYSPLAEGGTCMA